MGKALCFLIRAVIPKASSILLQWVVCGFVSPQHLLKTSYDVVKRWVNEAQEAASSDNIMVQVGKPPPTQGIASSRWAWSKLLELSQAPLGNRGDKSGKNTP